MSTDYKQEVSTDTSVITATLDTRRSNDWNSIVTGDTTVSSTTQDGDVKSTHTSGILIL